MHLLLYGHVVPLWACSAFMGGSIFKMIHLGEQEQDISLALLERYPNLLGSHG
jgi:hypothetical protein